MGGFLGIKLPKPEAFLHSYFSPLRGLLAVSPALGIAFWGLKSLREERAMFWFLIALLAANAYFTSSFDHMSWGWTTGPRHLTPMLPFMLLPMALALRRFSEAASSEQRLGYGAFAGLCATTVLVGGMGALINYVPDSVSTTLFGLALPLFTEGFWPVSLLSFFGLPNPPAGMLLVLGLLIAAGWVALVLYRTAPEATRATVRLGLLVAVVAHLGMLGAVSRHAAGVAAVDASKQFDFGARAHLKSVWLVRPGEAAKASLR